MINKISYLEPKGQPKQLVVFLHGFGSNKDDLISLSSYFAEIMPDALFVSPNAPYECDFMAEGYSWFSLDGVNLGDPNSIPERTKKEMLSSVKELNAFIDKLLEDYKIPDGNIYMIGFSQGATMSVYASLQRAVPVKAVIAYSGILFNDMNVVSKPSVVGVAHGVLDDVVPFFWHENNQNVLKTADLNVKDLSIANAFHEIPLEALEFGKNIMIRK